MIMKEIPKVRYAVIGGSGTWAGEYPENTGIEGIRILQRDMEFETPFGTTVPMKLFELDGSLTADGQPRQVLTVPFHGFHGLAPGTPLRSRCSGYSSRPVWNILWQKAVPAASIPCSIPVMLWCPMISSI